uniref:Uncharacterized protein n=1 Tax=Strigamia maritima TaxID=126957 RepID=T1JI22_STRMM
MTSLRLFLVLAALIKEPQFGVEKHNIVSKDGCCRILLKPKKTKTWFKTTNWRSFWFKQFLGSKTNTRLKPTSLKRLKPEIFTNLNDIKSNTLHKPQAQYLDLICDKNPRKTF